MAKQRNPNRDKAFEIYKNDTTIPLTEIAKTLDIPEGTIRGWKNKDEWETKIKGTFQKQNRNVPFKNKKNSTSNIKKNSVKKTSAVVPNKRLKTKTQPLKARYRNKNAMKTGEYEKIYFDDTLSKEEKEILSIPLDKIVHINLLIRSLMIRETRIMKRIINLEKSRANTDTSNEQSETIMLEYENALTNVQSRHIKALEVLHKFELDAERFKLDKKRFGVYKDKARGIINNTDDFDIEVNAIVDEQ